MSRSHNEIRYGDEYQCSNCGKSWGIDEPEVPDCTPIETRLFDDELVNRIHELESQVKGLISIFGEHGGEDDSRLRWSAKRWHSHLNIQKLRGTINTHE